MTVPSIGRSLGKVDTLKNLVYKTQYDISSYNNNSL